jgi:hypothetical protein
VIPSFSPHQVACEPLQAWKNQIEKLILSFAVSGTPPPKQPRDARASILHSYTAQSASSKPV